MVTPSRNQADKAGNRLKKFIREGGSLAVITANHDLQADVDTVQSWRNQFGRPLAGAAMGLRSMVKTCGVDAEPSQRHKRVERVIQKLARPNTTRLSTMQDIAGVRAVVPDIVALRKLQRHIERTWSESSSHTSGIVNKAATKDYIVNPRSSGYRAVHLIVDYNQLPVEVQLRTANQHFWADLSERIGRAVGVELKAGDGPPEIAEFFVELGERIGALDDGETTPWTLHLDLGPWGGQQVSVSTAS